MVLMMACELTFSTPTERGKHSQLSSGWGPGVSYGPLGAATRSPRRRRPFNFFRDSAWFLTQTRVLPDTDGRTTTTKPGSPQTPIPRTGNRQNFIAKNF